jgi:predicted Zn-dependent protease
MNSRSARGLFAALLLVLPLLDGCAVNPVTGRRQLALISEAQEIQMGQQAAVQVEQSIGLVQNDALQSYLHRVGTSLAAVSERPELPWTFRVVDDPTPNAFALPGGFIFVTRGMLGLMMNESELASVLGHEIGHVTARHSVSMMSRAQLAQIGLVLGQIAVPELGAVGDVAGAGMQLLFLH